MSKNSQRLARWLVILLALFCLVAFPGSSLSPVSPLSVVKAQSGTQIFIPMFSRIAADRKVNVPYFASTPPVIGMSVFWFGKVTPTENYADVRMGYTATELILHINTIDRQVWFNPASTASVLNTLNEYDGATVYLDLYGKNPRLPSSSAYRFEVQMNELWTHLPYHQRASVGNGQSWQVSTLSFTDEVIWRGEGANHDAGDRGWIITYHIPFSSLGLSGPPAQGTTWGLAIDLHDRDSSAGPANPVKSWPNDGEAGAMTFGIPAFVPPQVSSLSAPVSVRHGVNGVVVKDGMVGGAFLCGAGTDFWTTWGTANYYGEDRFNVQNQYDVADFPCFSKEYLTFPLPAVPAGKVLYSAKLTLHHFGNSSLSEANDSYIQVMRVGEDWNPASISWNTAPLALENYSGAWVKPTRSPSVDWPGTPYTFDITRAVADAYQQKVPLRLAVYSADEDRHSGKYFVSSFAEDWNVEGRPVIEIVYGTP